MFHSTSLKGLRPTNEDVELIVLNMNGKNKKYAKINLYMLLDGHGGKEISKLSSKLLKHYFLKSSNSYPLSEQQINNIYSNVQKIIIENPEFNGKSCGSTALILIHYNASNIQVINLGDCRAVLSLKGFSIPLTTDHKPNESNEIMRIHNVNNCTNNKREIYHDGYTWRIGDLSVSRSFGDLDNTPHITHIPEIFDFRLNNYINFIILGCDGLWDVVSNYEAVNFIKNNNNKNKAYALANYAIKKGSTDNVSIIIIYI